MKTLSVKNFWNLSEKEKKRFTGILKYKSGTIIFHENGVVHRLDGAAIIFSGTDRCDEYWIHGKQYTKEEFYKHPEVIKNSKEFKDVLKYKNL